MGISYSDKLRDARWQEKRLVIMNRDGFRCRNCDHKEGVTLNVHHVYYLKGKDPWDYPDAALWTICEGCHRDFERTRAEYEWAASFVDPKRYALFCTMAYSLANLLSGDTAQQVQESGYLLHRIGDILGEKYVNTSPPERRGFEERDPANQKDTADVLRNIENRQRTAMSCGRDDVARELGVLADLVRAELGGAQ